MNDEKLIEKETEREIVFKGKIFSIAKCKAKLYDEQIVNREIMLHSGGVTVLPIDNEGYVYLVKQYRYGASTILIESPAGKLEVGEDPYECAVRELSEETGFSSNNILSLGKMYSSPAIMSEIIYLYLARDLVSGKAHLDEGEFLDVLRVPFDEAVSMVLDGRITDAKTQIAILKAKEIMKSE